LDLTHSKEKKASLGIVNLFVKMWLIAE